MSQETPEPSVPSPRPVGGWGEVAAVLATAVVPDFATAIASAFDPEPRRMAAYWSDALTLTTRSVCVAFVVHYLILRSGEPGARFGMVRPRLSDVLLLAPALMLVDWLVWEARWVLVPRLDLLESGEWFPRPRQPADYVLMVVKHAANAFAEELVTRAYLITRLEKLLKSPAAAVLLAAAAFASYHAYQKTDAMIDHFFLGVAWGRMYLALRRLWPFVLAHAVYNVLIELR